MAIKTFTTGEVLTAADTNTYLANSGLVFVKSQTVGSGVSSVNVTSAFSSTYDNYKIIYSGGVASTNGNTRIQLGATTTGYYGVCIYAGWAAGTVNVVATNNGAQMAITGGYDTTFVETNWDLLSPFESKPTQGMGFIIDQNNQGHSVYRVANSTSYTDFTLQASTGTLTGGTITVYGYRKG